MPTVFSANPSSILLDGEPIEGLQSLAFHVATQREDIPAIGSDERVDVSFGLRTVEGELTVKSSNSALDVHLQGSSKFQLVAALRRNKGDEGAMRTVSFDDCFLEAKSFALGAGGTASTTYRFTAVRLREE